MFVLVLADGAEFYSLNYTSIMESLVLKPQDLLRSGWSSVTLTIAGEAEAGRSMGSRFSQLSLLGELWAIDITFLKKTR